MNEQTRLEVHRRLLQVRESGPEDAPRQTVLQVDRYLDPEQLEVEQARIFRRAPVVVAHTSELEEPGAFVRAEVGGVDLVAIRDGSEVRVFENRCSHRGAELVRETSGCIKAFSCPYHNWCYRLDGELFHVPSAEAFDALDLSAFALREVDSEVRHGFVWVSLSGVPKVGDFLGPVLDEDFRSYRLEDYVSGRVVERLVPANWKLVMDAFAEGYHLPSLHRKSLSRFFGEAAIVDACPPHIRQVGARRTLADEAADFDLSSQTTVFYNVFPNSILVFHPTWLTHLSLQPVGVGQVRVVHRMLVAPGVDPASVEASFQYIDEQVFAAEDIDIAASLQRGLRSGRSATMVLGALEEGMRLFHEARDRWIEGR